MLKNNKGFTVVELIASFVFTSILAITLFAAVMNYRDKQTDTVIETELIAFKSQLLIDIETDIQTKGLYSIEYADCNNADNSGTNPAVPIVYRCVDLHFNDGDTKMLLVARKSKVDKLLNEDGTETDFSISYAYISYGGVQYSIPDEDNVDIATDFFFEYTEPSEGLETNTTIYKVRMDLVHKDLPTNIVISFVATGSKYTPSDGGGSPYASYKIGDKLKVKLKTTYVNGEYQTNIAENFRVIKNSSGYQDYVVLLYDDAYDADVVNQIQYATVGSKIQGIKGMWQNADEVRLITKREVEYLTSTCLDRELLNLAPAPAWLTSSSFWTGSENTTGAWYVNGTSKQLLINSSGPNAKYAFRPVIVTKKSNIDSVVSY